MDNNLKYQIIASLVQAKVGEADLGFVTKWVVEFNDLVLFIGHMEMMLEENFFDKPNTMKRFIGHLRNELEAQVSKIEDNE